MTARLSVVIPAHDEARIIAPMLDRIIAGDPGGVIELIVVANGCTDDTARVAASVDPRVIVVEVAQPSKIAALNAGDRRASVLPRAYVDADVAIDADALLALADTLGGETALVAAPTFRVDTRASNWLVRQHYRIWELSEYRTTGHIGSGVYAVSAAGRARWTEFPDVIADDRFVQQRFALDERRTLSDHSFSVRAPRTFAAQLRRTIRIDAGNRQLSTSMQVVGTEPASSRYRQLVRRVAGHPSLWPALAVYAYGYAAPRLASRWQQLVGRPIAWNRDETVRA